MQHQLDHQAASKLPSPEFLSECFLPAYEDGFIRWNYRPNTHFASASSAVIWNEKYAFTPAGLQVTGRYHRVSFSWSGRKIGLGVHRILFVMANGYWPKEIDHIDGNPLNNSLSNLRATNRQGNTRNAAVRCDNLTGLKGVSHGKKGRYRAAIYGGGSRTHLGIYDTAEAASAAYQRAARELYGEHFCGGSRE